jgi:hypothetical protein
MKKLAKQLWNKLLSSPSHNKLYVNFWWGVAAAPGEFKGGCIIPEKKCPLRIHWGIAQKSKEHGLRHLILQQQHRHHDLHLTLCKHGDTLRSLAIILDNKSAFF